MHDPAWLAQQDLVITSYATLAAELPDQSAASGSNGGVLAGSQSSQSDRKRKREPGGLLEVRPRDTIVTLHPHERRVGVTQSSHCTPGEARRCDTIVTLHPHERGVGVTQSSHYTLGEARRCYTTITLHPQRGA